MGQWLAVPVPVLPPGQPQDDGWSLNSLAVPVHRNWHWQPECSANARAGPLAVPARPGPAGPAAPPAGATGSAAEPLIGPGCRALHRDSLAA